MGSPGSNNRPTGAHVGLSGSISTGGPTEIDVIETRQLEKFLADAGLYESHEETIKREEVLGRLDQIVKTWVKNISRAKAFNEQMVHEANAKIFTFGSYRLGVHSPGADIDTLCVGPKHATRNNVVRDARCTRAASCTRCSRASHEFQVQWCFYRSSLCKCISLGHSRRLEMFHKILYYKT